VGANWYVHRHNAKATLDTVYAFDPLPTGQAGSGLLSSTDDGQVAVRAQFQLSF
jgi:hypothetical protein